MTIDDFPEAARVPARLTLWTLHRKGRTATCEAVAHALGLELVLSVADDVIRTEVSKVAQDGEELAAEWRRMFEAKGWTA
jgi:hypothetical protein